ncbi:hypothetical protein HDU79_004005 [Rhizoclosmatium sp. JEL0117]|nr:hypothetical protein HDU79_004005 [Rhizoclosmatium sp. JEL0117]
MPRVEVQRRHRAHSKPTTATKNSSTEATVSFAALGQTGPSKPVSRPAGSTKAEDEDNGLGKKEKRQLRHDKWLEKMNGVYSARAIADKKKKKKDVFGVAADLSDIQGALEQSMEAPELVDEAADGMDEDGTTRKEAAPKAEKKKPVSQKARNKEGINEMLRMQSIMGHKAFKSNPLATIKTHLKNTL